MAQLAENATSLGDFELRGDALISYRPTQPTRIVWHGLVEGDFKIIYARHPYGGRFRITRWTGFRWIWTRSVRTEGHGVVPISSLVHPPRLELSLQKTRHASITFLGIFLIVFAIFLLSLRAGANIKVLFPTRGEWSFSRTQFQTALIYALPSVLIYSISLAAFWPGQMSPNSIDQWGEVVHGRITDVHTVLHTGFIWLTSRFSSTPAATLIVQIVLLSLGTGLALAELRRWSVNALVLCLLSVAIPIWPATSSWRPFSGRMYWLLPHLSGCCG